MSLSAVYPHRIRLRGPWECEPQGGGPPPHRVTVPCRWLEADLAGFHGVAVFSRKFGYPGRIDETEHVWLTCDGCTGVREVILNSQLLGNSSDHHFAYEVTSILSARNRLEVLVSGENDEAGLWGEVALEIRKDAYLGQVTAEVEALTLSVRGFAIGVAPQPLELYTLVDRNHVDYRRILPTAEGAPFSIELTDIAPTSQTLRLELINVSSIWYVVEMPITHLNSP